MIEWDPISLNWQTGESRKRERWLEIRADFAGPVMAPINGIWQEILWQTWGHAFVTFAAARWHRILRRVITWFRATTLVKQPWVHHSTFPPLEPLDTPTLFFSRGFRRCSCEELFRWGTLISTCFGFRITGVDSGVAMKERSRRTVHPLGSAHWPGCTQSASLSSFNSILIS